jgi:hypothetical protein
VLAYNSAKRGIRFAEEEFAKLSRVDGAASFPLRGRSERVAVQSKKGGDFDEENSRLHPLFSLSSAVGEN